MYTSNIFGRKKNRLLTYEMFANRFNKKNVGFDKMLATLMYNPNYTSDCLFISYLLNDNTLTIFFYFWLMNRQ